MRRFDPRSLAGLVWWNEAGNTTTVSGKADTLIDLSGNGFTATASAAAQRPTPGTDALGNHYLNCGQAATYSCMQFATSAFATLTAAEMWIVAQSDADPSVAGVGGCLFHITGDAAHATFCPYTDGSVYDSFGRNLNTTTGNPTPSLASKFAYQVRSGASEWSNHINGGLQFTTAINTVLFGATAMLFSGLQGGLGTWYFAGKYWEGFMRNRLSTAQEILLIKAYLGGKHKLVIT